MKQTIKDKALFSIQCGKNVMQILRDKRHEQKSKALAFALMYSILPTFLLINLTISLLPDAFFQMLENSMSVIPSQYQSVVEGFLQRYSYQDYGIIIYIILILFILYTVSTNVRLLIEISNDCYEKSEERSKYMELLISALLFITIGFSVIFLFAIVMAGQALRIFLNSINAANIANIIGTILQMKSILTVVVFFVIFYIIYYFAPNVKSTFKSTAAGALCSALGMLLASQFFEIYLSRSNSSVMVLYQDNAKYLLFFFTMYITCQIIVGSLIVNSLIYEKVSIQSYHEKKS